MKLVLTHGNLRMAFAQSRSSISLHTGRIIRRLRELSGTSQSDLARFSAANLSYISTLESGMNNISIRKILLICNALRFSPASLLAMQQCVSISAALDD